MTKRVKIPKSKTTISIENSLLVETDTVAKELGIPRSQVISKALVWFLNQYRSKQLLAKINAAYPIESDSEEMEAMDLIRSHQKKQVFL
jgi:metal-responsive CopG/Arc/MetJ family transcriptional regulator